MQLWLEDKPSFLTSKESIKERGYLRPVAPEIYYAFHGLALSLRRTGRASVGVATMLFDGTRNDSTVVPGRRELNLPRKRSTLFLRGLPTALSRRSLRTSNRAPAPRI